MKRKVTWLTGGASALIALSVVAANFEVLELSLYSGWAKGEGIVVLGDGTLRVSRADADDTGNCAAHVSQEELNSLYHLIDEIPDNAPWGRQLVLPDKCSDETEATLLVSTSRGELDVRHSVDCRPAEVPTWVTDLYEALRQIQKKYDSCD